MVASLYVEAELNIKRTLLEYSRFLFKLDSSAGHFFKA